MASPLQNLEPQLVWQHFDALRQVPRPSKREGQVVAHVRSWAAQHGLAVRADAAGNLVVAVPPSPGCAAAPTVVLQAHLDMVCEQNAGMTHDFDRDPIQVEVNGDWVRAVGTTLGADNGIGVAAAMAVAVDRNLQHGPLELLFTLDEETGLNGALALDGTRVSGRLLINLDTEEDGALYIGCAGSGGLLAELPLERVAERPGTQVYELAVRGLRGGHSGIDIIENRGNATKLAVRVLLAARERGADLGLIAINGGSKANAIPRECFTLLSLTAEAAAALETSIREQRAEFQVEFQAIDPQLEIALAPARANENAAWQPLSGATRDRLLRLIAGLPHGVIAMSREVAGLVETSNNVAVVSTEKELATIHCSCRSSVSAAMRGTLQSLRALGQLAGVKITERPGYSGWKPNPQSALVLRSAAVYARLFGAPPAIKAVHAGLECGILSEKLPGLDAVSMGPDIRGAHSPEEQVKISSVAKFYRLLQELLTDLAARPQGEKQGAPSARPAGTS